MPLHPTPSRDAVHLWTMDLRLCPEASLLSDLEQARVQRFARPEDRLQFQAARTALRQILARYTGRDPQNLTLLQTSHGKPYLADGPAFNLSHSGHTALLAIAQQAVGVDLELHRSLPDLEDVAAHIMTPAERQVFQTLAGPAREAAFYSLWTRKESLLKALGTGLTVEPNQLQMGLAPAATTHFAGRTWTTLPLTVQPESSAALTLETAATPRILHFSL